MATQTLCPDRPSLWLPGSIKPKTVRWDNTTLSTSDPSQLVHAQPLPIPLCFHSKRPWKPRPNLHSLRPGPAVSCIEGFCNASEGQRLPSATDMASQKPHRSANGVPRVGSAWARPSVNYRTDGPGPPCYAAAAHHGECLMRRREF